MRVAEHWIRQGIDGWRLDVPFEITTEGFWQEFRQRVKAINPDATSSAKCGAMRVSGSRAISSTAL